MRSRASHGLITSKRSNLIPALKKALNFLRSRYSLRASLITSSLILFDE